MTTHHGLRAANAELIARERAELTDQEEEFARARMKRRQREKRERHDAVAKLRAEMQQEIATLRAELAQSHDVLIEAAGFALGKTHDKLLSVIEARMKEIADEFTDLARKLAELAGRLDALVPMEPRERSFKFANEPDVELPNPLRPRRALDS
jgi:DNA anti-recombination protein RmuC